MAAQSKDPVRRSVRHRTAVELGDEAVKAQLGIAVGVLVPPFGDRLGVLGVGAVGQRHGGGVVPRDERADAEGHGLIPGCCDARAGTRPWGRSVRCRRRPPA